MLFLAKNLKTFMRIYSNFCCLFFFIHSIFLLSFSFISYFFEDVKLFHRIALTWVFLYDGTFLFALVRLLRIMFIFRTIVYILQKKTNNWTTKRRIVFSMQKFVIDVYWTKWTFFSSFPEYVRRGIEQNKNKYFTFLFQRISI